MSAWRFCKRSTVFACSLIAAVSAISCDKYENAGVVIKNNELGVYIERDFEGNAGTIRFSPSPGYLTRNSGEPATGRFWVNFEQHKGSYRWISDPPYQEWLMEYAPSEKGVRALENRGADWKAAVGRYRSVYLFDHEGDGLPEVLAIGPTMYPCNITLGSPMSSQEYDKKFGGAN